VGRNFVERYFEPGVKERRSMDDESGDDDRDELRSG